MPNHPFASVRVDNSAVGRLAAEHLLECGLSCFAYAGHPRFLSCTERETAFREAIGAAGYNVACYHSDPRREFATGVRQWYLGKRVHHWLLNLPRPVGLFVPGDFWGVELTHICHQLDLRIPEDVAVVGVGNDELHCEFSRPKLSSIALPTQQIGYAAAALLERLMLGEEPPVQHQLLSPLFVHPRRSSESLAVDDEDVVAAARFIREQAHLEITVADVVREVPLSRRSLERRFQLPSVGDCSQRSIACDCNGANNCWSKPCLICRPLPDRPGIPAPATWLSPFGEKCRCPQPTIANKLA